MELVTGRKYLYSNVVKVGRQCKKTKKQEVVTYVGSEDNKKVFQKESGTELLLHKTDIDEFIKEISQWNVPFMTYWRRYYDVFIIWW